MVEALSSELVPVEINLREKPAELLVSAVPEADFLALDRERAASAIETRSAAGNISRADLDDYREALKNRERLRIAAGSASASRPQRW
jgi:hypothetical protein